MPANTLLKCLLALWHTGIIVLSTNVIPVHHPKAYIFMKSISLTKILAMHLTKHR